jgi:hypothetical protein
VLATTREHGLEGVVAKRLGSPYVPGVGNGAWVKHKHRRTESFLVTGWTPPERRRPESLLLARIESDGTNPPGASRWCSATAGPMTSAADSSRSSCHRPAAARASAGSDRRFAPKSPSTAHAAGRYATRSCAISRRPSRLVKLTPTPGARAARWRNTNLLRGHRPSVRPIDPRWPSTRAGGRPRPAPGVVSHRWLSHPSSAGGYPALRRGGQGEAVRRVVPGRVHHWARWPNHHYLRGDGREQLARGRAVERGVQPGLPELGVGEDDRHAVVDRPDQLVRLAGDDRATRNDLAVGQAPAGPEARKAEESVVDEREMACSWMLVGRRRPRGPELCRYRPALHAAV